MTDKNKQNTNKPSTDLAKFSKTVLISIPSAIPHENIKLTKLPDGYKLSACYRNSAKEGNGSVESSYQCETEERYGVKVKSVEGGYDKEGVYKINLVFEEE